jgi:hypothetical protein
MRISGRTIISCKKARGSAVFEMLWRAGGEIIVEREMLQEG